MQIGILGHDVALGDHAHQAPLVDHGNAADVVRPQQVGKLLDGRLGADGDRVAAHDVAHERLAGILHSSTHRRLLLRGAAP